MPSLSIVIPYRQNDQRLEATILSVLENRPADCEVIVVHDGSYLDPYALGDELLFVEADKGCNTVGLINAGLLAACSPVVNTLIDGTTVQSGWSDSACHQLANSADVAAVACAVATERETTCGLDATSVFDPIALRAGKVLADTSSRDCAGPELACGFFSRRVLMALGGLNDGLDVVAAAVDMAWALDELGLRCVHDGQSESARCNSATRKLSPAALQQLASIAVACEMADTSIRVAAFEFLRGCLAGHPIAALAWSQGLLSAPRHSPAVRLRLAREHLASNADSGQPSPGESKYGQRRAA